MKDSGPTNLESDEDENEKKVSHILLYFLVGVIGICAVLFVIANLFERAVILKSSHSVVRSNTISVRSQTNGTYKRVLPENVKHVKTRQILAQIIPSPGSNEITVGPKGLKSASSSRQVKDGKKGVEVIESPCDCYIVRGDFRDEDSVFSGELLFSLVPAKAKMWVDVALSSEDIQGIKLGDSVLVRIAGMEGNIKGKVGVINPIRQDQRDSLPWEYLEPPDFIVEIHSKEIVFQELIDRPAQVSFLP